MIRAIYGGTFDPFHNGHLSISSIVLENNLTDILHIIPAGQAPGKAEPVASSDDRLGMVAKGLMALDSDLYRRAALELIETQRGGATYTVDTLEEMADRYPDTQWRLVIGEE